jgi:hypothetical protein
MALTRHGFMELLEAYKESNDRQRHGQAVFNLAHRIDATAANTLRSGPLDPFYDDSRVDAFLDAFSTASERLN